MTTLTLTVRQAVEAYSAIEAWGRQKLPAKAAYWLSVTKRRLEPAVMPFIETRNERLVEAKEEDRPGLEAEFNALLSEQVDVDVKSTGVEAFADASVPPAIVLALLPFLTGPSWETVETKMSFPDLAEASVELSAALSEPVAFGAAYFIAYMADSVKPHTESFWNWRLEEAKKRDLLTESGTLDLKSPDTIPFLELVEQTAKERGDIVLRHPVVPFAILDRPGVSVTEALLSSIWFAWKESDD